MNFRSDNTAAIAPQILSALNKANTGRAAAYGGDAWTQLLDEAFSQVFERAVRVFTVATGTAANAIAIASLVPPWGAIYCHREAHIEVDEAGAAGFFSGGAKLSLLDGAHAKVAPSALRAAPTGLDIHASKPAALSISQASERGAVYKLHELEALGTAAQELGLKYHMDGARLANAIAHLGCAPAAATWRAGVDVLSFGATKNGAMAGEAVVAFDLDRVEAIEKQRKRSGHLLCKGRYPAVQLLAYLKGDLWLRLAADANAMAQEIAAAAGALVSAPVEANMVLIKPGASGLQRLRDAGVSFYDWGPGEARLVTSWQTSAVELNALCALLRTLR